MKLPNGINAIVPEAKLRDYCLSPTHPRGRNKARLFSAALGMTPDDSDSLRSQLLNAVRGGEAVPTKRNNFGQVYEIRFQAIGPSARAELLSVWILRDDDGFPYLVTCYPV
jgi:hypothetical protein